MTPDLVTAFSALGDPNRFAILERLLRDGAQSAGDLQDVADISAPAVSRHLKVLREAGLISQRVDAQRRIYSANPAAVRAINDWTMDHAAFWGASLDRLAAALNEEG
ncbi:metalloregulator ArsR/SmtB family transcription factor [Psychromarinibacter sp. C21-152]|uniref:Metalloregulator ArsR/SmtB family transcription factor n=1 Tax=Psychromarinibacter sediminicola TaxID=3033385 RepID=A0AAE3T9N2_9RHOB|nr:metalloregulator ArsR/SmtB family transcription factor [Psychromarinibacter sediminicola]MDF0601179.1 metalloregulator ArsR/SmtB family transcription factor [Psychromarinibacter sediminicola]